MKKSLFIVPQIGFNDVELPAIKRILEKNSVKCDIASFSLGNVISKTGKRTKADKIICNIKASDYDCFIFVGGENVSSLAEHKCVINLIKSAHKENKLIVLLCINAALLLPKANLIEGRKVTVFKMKNNWSTDAIKKNKGILVDEPVVIDGNIITCRDEKDAELAAKWIILEMKR
ncbi:DJ-1/PfpI family protein [Candidatus Woesearchaeota archaeon]|nr:DJ-1/PfpI family protein [Candidatus Woesearchaeota archaeon]